MKTLRNLVLLLIFLPVISHSYGQNTGFYGRKLFVELNSTSQVPLIAMIFKNTTYDIYASEYNTYSASNPKDKFDTGLNLTFGGAVSPKAALSIEAGLFFSSITPPQYEYNYYNDDYQNFIWFQKHDNFNIRTFTLMPKVEISGRGGTSPGGLSHQIGIGFASTRVADKDYEYRVASSYPDSILGDPSRTTLDFDQKYKGITLMYAIVMRVPINKQLMFNYGLRYTANIPLNGNVPKGNPAYWASNSEVASLIAKTRGMSVINLQIGFTVML